MEDMDSADLVIVASFRVLGGVAITVAVDVLVPVVVFDASEIPADEKAETFSIWTWALRHKATKKSAAEAEANRFIIDMVYSIYNVWFERINCVTL